jgi:hypothetical protein
MDTLHRHGHGQRWVCNEGIGRGHGVGEGIWTGMVKGAGDKSEVRTQLVREANIWDRSLVSQNEAREEDQCTSGKYRDEIKALQRLPDSPHCICKLVMCSLWLFESYSQGTRRDRCNSLGRLHKYQSRSVAVKDNRRLDWARIGQDNLDESCSVCIGWHLQRN